MDNHLLAFVLCLTVCFPTIYSNRKLAMLMPNVQPMQKDTYFCTSFKMNKNDHEFIVKFEPNATMNVAHHILLYGCKEPGYVQRDTPRIVWACSEMAAGAKSGYQSAPTCGEGSQVIYAWARDAPALDLPEGVGFKVGKGTGINYIVLQVHYADVSKFSNGGTDDSGIVITLVPSDDLSVRKLAGVFLLGTAGQIPPLETEYMETACKMEEPIKIHPFAFRTHAHALGKVVSGYVIQDGKWKLIGKHDPQEPQMFYPVENKDLVIKKGDTLVARCTMYNFRNRVTYVGPTGDDEMCNFYMMYYVNGDQTLDVKYCFSPGPPYYYWQTDRKVGKVPEWVDKDASTLKK